LDFFGLGADAVDRVRPLVREVLAIFGRAEARDFVDLRALEPRYDLERWAASASSPYPPRGDRSVMAARRSVDDLLEDLAEAVDAAAKLVALGKEQWDAERPLRLAGEAVVGASATSQPSFRASSSPARASSPGLRSKAFGSSSIAYHGID